MSSISKTFSHIYVEEDARSHPRTEALLARFPKANIIPVSDYKEVFSRNQQNFSVQKKSQQLILAKRRDEFLYKGSGIAPDFGAEHFYYNTLALNCLYDCEYCYLQGMFPSAHIVLFVNNEDFLQATEKAVQELGSMYLCLSYDTDLLAMEHLTGYCKEWIDFSRDKNLTIEIRTKSVAVSSLLQQEPHDNLRLAWTLSPERYVKTYEHGTPKLYARLQALRQVAEHGYPVRVCIDPILPLADWKSEYMALLEQIAETVNAEHITEISLGTFRIGKPYFKKLKKVRPYSKLIHQQFEESEGIIHHPQEQEREILEFTRSKALSLFPAEKVDVHFSDAA